MATIERVIGCAEHYLNPVDRCLQCLQRSYRIFSKVIPTYITSLVVKDCLEISPTRRYSDELGG